MRRHIVHIAAVLIVAGMTADPSVAQTATGVRINEIMASNRTTFPDMVDFGDYEDWIELHNASGTPVDLSGYSLTDDPALPSRWSFGSGVSIPAGGFLLVWADGLDDHPGSVHTRPWWPGGQEFTVQRHHANFRLDRAGEGVYLFDPFGAVVDSVTFGEQIADVSLGRQPDGHGAWVQFAEATPEASNLGSPVTDPLPAGTVVADPPGGLFDSPPVVTLDALPEGTIHYTLDGSIPRSDSPVYTGPVPLPGTTVLRTRIIEPGRLPGPVSTQTYVVGPAGTLPVASLSTDPALLFDSDLGIYLNSYREREIPVGFEYFEDGTRVVSIHAGARIGGENIYRFAQKPFNLYFRGAYGATHLDWPVFDDLPHFEYKRLFLRNGGDDWSGSLLRDGLVRELLKGQTGNVTQAFRPAVLYLNGAYWGIYNLREKIDERYFELHHGVVPADLDHLEYDGTVITGDASDYLAMLAYARANDLAEPTHFAAIEAQVDLESLIDFVIAEVLIANPSWSHNREIWRDRASDARWKWVVVDSDRGLHPTRVADPTLRTIRDELGLFEDLLGNPSFRNRFLRRLALLINTTFRPARVVARIDSLHDLIADEIPAHAAKWGPYIDSLTIDVWGQPQGIQSAIAWEADVDLARGFAADRPAVVFDQAVGLFGIEGTVGLSIGSDPVGSGRVRVEGKQVSSGTWFAGIPLALDATPPPGMQFRHWVERRSGHSTTVIPRGSTWRYRDDGSAPVDWAETAFDDTAWTHGAAELGYGDGDETTLLAFGTDPLDKTIAYYFRTEFQAPDPTDLADLVVRISADDGAVVYLNGSEIGRLRMPDGPVDATTLASANVSDGEENRFESFTIDPGLLDAGRNVMAVEVHQSNPGSSDLSFDLELDAHYTYGDPVDRIVSGEPAFPYTPYADATLIAVFEPGQANVLDTHIDSDVVLDASSSPYYVEGTVTVAPGGVVHAGPGVEILMAPGASLVVEGRLHWIGSAPAPVRVRSLYPGEPWGTVCVAGGAGWTEFHHVHFSGSGSGEPGCPATVTAVDTRVRVHDSVFEDIRLPVRTDRSEFELVRTRIARVTAVGDYLEANGGTVLIEDSEFAGNDLVDMDAIDVGGMPPGSVIRGNVIRDFSGFNSDGIDLGEASTGVLIVHNTIHDCRDKAVSVGGGSSARIERNVIVRCGQGVGVKDSLSLAEIVHTTFHDNDLGVAVFEKNAGRGGASASVVNSIFSRSRTASVWADELSTLSIRFSASDTDDLPGDYVLRVDPKMIDPDRLVAGLQVVSPLINLGDPALPFDPDGTRADLGAVPYAGLSTERVVINEIMYNASAALDTGDWLELHNPTDAPVDVSEWRFVDESSSPSRLTGPAALIDPRGYVVLSREPDLFAAAHTGLPAPEFVLESGLSGAGEGLWLYDAHGALVDEVTYSDVAPWPAAADGTGPSLELIDPLLDNNLATSWRASALYGTPGWRNSTYVGLDDAVGTLPASFDLDAAWPNPFNPSTRIRYHLPEASRVELQVFDVLGRRVETLVDASLPAGTHEVSWTAGRAASGVYFVRMNAEPAGGGAVFRATRRVVLMR